MIAKRYLTPEFLGIAIILAIGLILRQSPERSLEHRPVAIPLQIPLANLPKNLGNFEFVEEINLHESVERKLGADEQITWVYQDQGLGKNEAGSALRLHAAFYTGHEQTMRVRHVPEVCYVNFGYTAVNTHRGTVEVGDGDISIPLQIFSFSPENDPHEYATAYCFIANGQYFADSANVQLACSAPDNSTSYFIKIEILPGAMVPRPDGPAVFAPSPSNTEQILRRSQHFLNALIPELKKHLP